MLASRVSGRTMTLIEVSTRSYVVDPVRDHGLVRLLQGLDDLLVVLEQSQIRSWGVDDVVEVDLEVDLRRQVALLDLLQVPETPGADGRITLRKLMTPA